MKRIGKRGRMSFKARKRIERIRLDKGIYYCEMCGGTAFCGPAHKKKRRYYRTAKELSDFDQWLWLCQPCHNKLEYDKKLTKQWFKKLR